MNTWLSIGGWVCVAVTVAGIVLSVMVWRKKGPGSGLRGIAWSLIPIAAYLTHSVWLIGQIVSAVVQFAGSFVFSPKAWLGVGLLGISIVLFVVSGGAPLMRGRKRRQAAKAAKAGKATRSVHDGQPPASVPATRQHSAVPADDDDLGDVRDILRRHGITKRSRGRRHGKRPQTRRASPCGRAGTSGQETGPPGKATIKSRRARCQVISRLDFLPCPAGAGSGPAAGGNRP